MGVSMYLAFNSKLWSPSSHKRLAVFMGGLVCYLVFGALMFSALDISQGRMEIAELISYKNQFFSNHSCVEPADAERLLDEILMAFDKGIFILSSNQTDYVPKWIFGGESIFFTFTLLSTIGYGHLVPSTQASKLFTIFYIVFGVPLTLTLFSAIVEHLLELIHSSQANGSDQTQMGLDASSQHTPYYVKLGIAGFVLLFIVYLLPAFVLSSYMESKWSFLDAIYYCYISIATIGLGMVLGSVNFWIFLTDFLLIQVIMCPDLVWTDHRSTPIASS
jgi:hypothetical protein